MSPNPGFDTLKRRFREYAETFADSPETLPVPMQLKIDHTFDVCAITEFITEREMPFQSPRAKYLALLTALFHDVSRFRQFRDYHTFQDADSFDHGKVSAEILEQEFRIPDLTGQEMRIVSTAVRHHNAKILPDGLPPEVLPFARLIRDADKLSIVKIVNAYFALPPEQQDPAVRIGTEDTQGFSEKLAEDAIRGIQIAHADMRNV